MGEQQDETFDARVKKAHEFQSFIKTRLLVDQNMLQEQLVTISSELQSWYDAHHVIGVHVDVY
jgi:hypothetical protein